MNKLLFVIIGLICASWLLNNVKPQNAHPTVAEMQAEQFDQLIDRIKNCRSRFDEHGACQDR